MKQESYAILQLLLLYPGGNLNIPCPTSKNNLCIDNKMKVKEEKQLTLFPMELSPFIILHAQFMLWFALFGSLGFYSHWALCLTLLNRCKVTITVTNKVVL